MKIHCIEPRLLHFQDFNWALVRHRGQVKPYPPNKNRCKLFSSSKKVKPKINKGKVAIIIKKPSRLHALYY